MDEVSTMHFVQPHGHLEVMREFDQLCPLLERLRQVLGYIDLYEKCDLTNNIPCYYLYYNPLDCPYISGAIPCIVLAIT